MQIYGLRINGLENPIGYDFRQVMCSWKVKGALGTQHNAKIEVALESGFLESVYEKEGPDLDCTGEPLNFLLKPYTRYYYRVTVHGSNGDMQISESSFFETAKLSEEWTAAWIGAAEEKEPEFCRQFQVKSDVKKATLYICGLGLFECYLNGEKIGKDVLAPFWNDYEDKVQYCTYDVTEQILQENELTVFLGKGWYQGRFGLGGHGRKDRKFALIAELHILCADGSIQIIKTDETWKYRASCYTLTDIYDGETQDYIIIREGNSWRKAVLLENTYCLCERQSGPLMEMEQFPVKKLIHTPKGELVLDFGQNFAGYVECTQEIPYGDSMTWEFGEILQDGCFYHDNYRTAKALFTYVSDGRKRIIKPHFTFFGFRYVKVSGLQEINPECFVGRAVYSQMEQTGFIETGNEKINQLFSNTLWGLKSNFVDIPTDCPQRDERLAWNGDAQVFAPTAAFHMDTRAFYRKYMRALLADQKRNGGRVAIYLPNEFPGLCAAVWSDIATFLPKMYYEYYGDKETLKEFYPLMKDWVEYIHGEDVKRGQKNLYDFGFQFGDWLALDGATEQSTFGRTENFFVSSVYYYASTSYVAEMAGVLGLQETELYKKRAELIKEAILEEYFTGSGRLAIDTQTGYLIALRFGVYRDKQRLIDGLKNRIKKDCNRIKGGFVGATMMNMVLAENGMCDLAYDFLFYEGFPGWLYAVNLGATTIWERWNSVLPNGKISGTGMNSLNHYSYGAVMEFMYRYTMGIQPLTPGFQRVRIAPQPDIRFGYLKGKYESVHGTYLSEWKIREDGQLQFHIEIPFGCEAELVLPEKEPQFLGAGSYDFVCATEKEYRALYSETTPLERLWADDRAVALFEKYLPQLLAETDRTDIEAMSKSMVEIKYRAELFRMPTEAHDALLEELRSIKA